MNFVIVLLGATLVIIAMILLIKPEIGFDFARKHFLSKGFQYGISVFSVVLAAPFYLASATSNFSALFEIIALFSLVGGVCCIVLPPEDFRSIISWELRVFAPYGCVLGIWYGLIGGFFIYAVS